MLVAIDVASCHHRQRTGLAIYDEMPITLPLAPSGTVVRQAPPQIQHLLSPCCPPTLSCHACPAQRLPKRNNDDDPSYSSPSGSSSGSLFTSHTTPALLAEPNRRNRYAVSYTELLPSPPPPPPAILAAARSPLVPARWRRVRALTS